MKHRLFRAIATMAIALGAVAAPSGAATVHAGSKVCTGWTSTVTPPSTIRVYRHATRTVDVVPFRMYVEKVLASEWGAGTTRPALEAGAITVKQYAWYFAIHWRGRSDPAGHCYDVTDSTADQLYLPSRKPAASHLAAVQATWWISLRKGSSFFMTGYRPGTGRCTAHLDRWHLYQRDASDCVRTRGDSRETLLRRFYAAAVTHPGANDATGDARGDVVLAITDPATGDVSTRILTTDPAFATVHGATARRAGLSAAAAGTPIALAAADVTGDGRVDLVQLERMGTAIEIKVLRATDKGFATATTWWSSAADPTPIPATDLRLVVGDFNADGRADVGLVSVVTGEAPAATLFVARTASAGDRLGAMRRQLVLAGDWSNATFLAGDFSGDDRTDLAILADVTPAATSATLTPTSVIEMRVAVSVAAPGAGAWPTTRAPLLWATTPGHVATRRYLVADIDRNGRSDVVYASAHAGGTALAAMRSTGSAFTPPRALAPIQPLQLRLTQFVLSDMTRDGRADLVAVTAASGGTDVWRFTMATQTLKGGTVVPVLKPGVRWLTGVPVGWETLAAY